MYVAMPPTPLGDVLVPIPEELRRYGLLIAGVSLLGAASLGLATRKLNRRQRRNATVAAVLGAGATTAGLWRLRS